MGGLPNAYAPIGRGNTVVVKDCPYCHEAHYHGNGGFRPISISGSRVADCGGGQYELTPLYKKEERFEKNVD
jgi:hypothetical protein